MTTGERLRQIRIKRGMSQEEVAKHLNTTKQTIYKYENGVVANIPIKRIEQLAALFHVTPEYLAGWGTTKAVSDEIMPITTTQKPLLGAIACGTPILAVDNVDTEIDVPTEFASCDFALRCKGDSMDGGKYPIRDGSIVYIKEQPVVDDGQIAAVLIGEEATLKIVYWNEQAHTLTLLPQNPSYSPIVVSGPDLELEGVKILGRAIGYTAAIA